MSPLDIVRLEQDSNCLTFRLRRIFYFLSIGNLVWIVWSMILVECTLNYNHVKEVLGPGNRIFFPSQLIPLIIGTFSFVRLIYKVLKKARGQDDEPALPANPHFSNPRQDVPGAKRFFKVFAPPTNSLNPRPQLLEDIPLEDTDIDILVQDEPIRLRYLITWLPWLSLLPWWASEGPRQDPSKRGADVEDGRRLSLNSTLQGTPTTATFVNPYKPQIP